MADNLKELTAGIVASYVEANTIAAADLPASSIAAKSAVNAAPKTPKGENAGPGARVAKAVRSPNVIAPAGDEFT